MTARTMTARALVALSALVFAGAAMAQARPPAAPAGTASAPLLPGGNSRDPINIDAQKLEWFDGEQKAVYSGDVVVVQGEGSLKASALTIFLQRDAAAAGTAQPAAGPGGGSSQIQRMEARGPVTVVQKDQVGTGDSGVYDKAQNKVFLIGNVTLSQGANVTTGDRLVYDLETKAAVVESGGTQQRVKGLFIPGSGGADAAPAPAPARRAP